MGLELFSKLYVGLKLKDVKIPVEKEVTIKPRTKYDPNTGKLNEPKVVKETFYEFAPKYALLNIDNNDYDDDDDYWEDLVEDGAQILDDCNFVVHCFSSNTLDEYFITLPDGMEYLYQEKYNDFIMNMNISNLDEIKKELKRETEYVGLWDESLFGVWYVSSWM